MRHKIQILFLVLIFTGVAVAQTTKKNSTYQEYIDKYKFIAVRQMYEYNIPASITIAQGLFESGAGQSNLAKMSNNHFGIKCGGDWTGESITYDDDSKGECFRKYATVLESYEDHSKFLKGRSRYAKLFDLKRTDYKGWANGLKQCGYATNPKYASMLINLIELYELDKLDHIESAKEIEEEMTGISASNNEQSAYSLATSSPKLQETQDQRPITNYEEEYARVGAQNTTKNTPHKPQTSQHKAGSSWKTAIKNITHSMSPKSSGEKTAKKASKPAATASASHKVKKEAPKATAKRTTATVDFTGSGFDHTIYKNNDCYCIKVKKGDTFRSLEKSMKRSRFLLARDNELLGDDEELEPGMFIYLEKKKNSYSGTQKEYVVKPNDSMYSISQRFGITLSALYKLNGKSKNYTLRVGDVLKLK